MNVIKGVARIALVLGIIAAIPGFLGGWNIYKAEKTIEIRVPTKSKLTAEEYLEGSKEKFTPEEYEKRFTKKSARDFLNEKPRDLIEEIRKDPIGTVYRSEIRYHYPPNWQCAIAGVIGSIVAFIIIFFGISGITRVFLWIVRGFKDENKV